MLLQVALLVLSTPLIDTNIWFKLDIAAFRDGIGKCLVDYTGARLGHMLLTWHDADASV